MNRVESMFLPLAVGVAAFSAAAAEHIKHREDEIVTVSDIVLRETVEAACDLRTAFPVAQLEGKALKGLMYSANGWERNAAADASCTATITARAGTLANGVFTPDGSAEVTVATGLTGDGTVDWEVNEISKKICQLTHTVRKGGSVDAAGTCYGYLDFTHCVSCASQADVEAAVLGAITHEISVVQDEDWPWQPIDASVVRSGLATDETLPAQQETATAFAFVGSGKLFYEYGLRGGMLAVIVDGEQTSAFSIPTADWTPAEITISEYGSHEVVFRYTSDGVGGSGALRNVQWKVEDLTDRALSESCDTRVDFQDGVRAPKRMAHVLPFEYSSTNWVGFVEGVKNVSFSAESVARVKIVQLTGTDPDVRNWNEEVPGTFRELVKNPGEGAVKWRPKKGVWKATFDILNGDESVHQETTIFDLRNSSGTGFALILS